MERLLSFSGLETFAVTSQLHTYLIVIQSRKESNLKQPSRVVKTPVRTYSINVFAEEIYS